MKSFLCLIAASLFVTFSNGKVPPLKKSPHLYIAHFENVLGTSLELKITSPSKAIAQNGEEKVLSEISRMSKILSAYDPSSEFSRWFGTQQQAIKISPELFEVLQLFDEWRVRSGGVLDASAEAVSRLWKKDAAMNRVPGAEELATVLSAIKQPHWKLDAAAHTATHLDNTPLVLNSFVKSYIIKHAASAAMHSGNMNAVVVNIGGDLVVAGDAAEIVAITDPVADAENEAPIGQLLVNNKAVATSGNYRRGELINGHWYSHIVDPRTGQPADNIISATVVADNATDAGALATAFNVMTPAESIQLGATIPGAEYLIITKNGERIASKGWDALTVPVKKTIERTIQNNTAAEYELMINLEIKTQQQGFAKRPYVAVWVEDENHAPVRTITVWHGSDRYMNELKSWYLKYRNSYTSDNNFRSTVTSATRSPGKYTLKWDGKDDKGNMLKQGRYTIKIEISREHGTYQLMRQEIDLDEKPKQLTLAGNTEIESVMFDYRKKN